MSPGIQTMVILMIEQLIRLDYQLRTVISIQKTHISRSWAPLTGFDGNKTGVGERIRILRSSCMM